MLCSRTELTRLFSMETGKIMKYMKQVVANSRTRTCLCKRCKSRLRGNKKIFFKSLDSHLSKTVPFCTILNRETNCPRKCSFYYEILDRIYQTVVKGWRKTDKVRDWTMNKTWNWYDDEWRYDRLEREGMKMSEKIWQDNRRQKMVSPTNDSHWDRK